MSHEIETLLTQYETGRLTRRELLGVLALATASAPLRSPRRRSAR